MLLGVLFLDKKYSYKNHMKEKEGQNFNESETEKTFYYLYENFEISLNFFTVSKNYKMIILIIYKK